MSEILQHAFVGSSNIAECKYNEDTHELDVKFIKGAWYRYAGVSLETYQGFISAPSAGIFFTQYIKNGGYSYKKF